MHGHKKVWKQGRDDKTKRLYTLRWKDSRKESEDYPKSVTLHTSLYKL